LPLLKSVGRPCVINPDRKLRREAKAMGWRIREYRTKRQALLLAAKTGFAIVSGLLGWRVIRRLKTHRRTYAVTPQPEADRIGYGLGGERDGPEDCTAVYAHLCISASHSACN